MNTAFIQFVDEQITDHNYREQVVRLALDHRSRVSRQISNRLKTLINQLKFPIKGFEKNPGSAPTDRLVGLVVLLTRTQPAILDAVLDIWTEAQGTLKSDLMTYLRNNGLIETEATTSIQRTLAQRTDKELRDVAAEYCSFKAGESHEPYGECHHYDVLLMLYCLLGQVPPTKDVLEDGEHTAESNPSSGLTDNPDTSKHNSLEEDDDEKEDQEQTQVQMPIHADEQGGIAAMPGTWALFLAQLESLAPEDEAWNSFSNYLLAAQAIADRKQQEREISRDALRRALETLSSRLESHAEYFDFVVHTTWSADQCALSDIPQRVQQVAALDQALIRYSEIEARPVRTRAERRKRDAEAETLEQKIEQLYQELAQSFARSDAPLTNGPSPGIEDGTQPAELMVDEDLPVELIDDGDLPVELIDTEVLTAEDGVSDASTEYSPRHVGSPSTAELDLPVVDSLLLTTPNQDQEQEVDETNHSSQHVEVDRTTNQIDAEHHPAADPPGTLDEDPTEEKADIEAFTVDETLVPALAEHELPPAVDETLVPALAEYEPPLADAVAGQLNAWLSSWEDLPKADLLAAWLNANDAQLASRFPARGLYTIAYYAFQPANGGGPPQSPPLTSLEDTLGNTAAPDLWAAAWQVGAGLVILRGEISVLDMLHVYDITQESQFAPWHPFAEALNRYAQRTNSTLSEAARRMSEMQQRPNPAPLAAKARQALDQLTQPARFPYKAGRDLIARIDRDLARLSRAITSRPIQATSNAMTVQEAAKWARELKPSTQLQQWARASNRPDSIATRTELQVLEVDLRALQRAVVVWTSAELPITEDVTLLSFTELRDTVTEHAAAWRAMWMQHQYTWPALVAWSDLLLQRVSETLATGAYAEERQK